MSSFVMIYLTNTVGLNPGIVGSLIAASKRVDGTMYSCTSLGIKLGGGLGTAQQAGC